MYADHERGLLLSQLSVFLSLLLGCFHLTPDEVQLLQVSGLLPLDSLGLSLLFGSSVGLPQFIKHLLLLLPQLQPLLSASHLSGSLRTHLLLSASVLDGPQLLTLIPENTPTITQTVVETRSVRLLLRRSAQSLVSERGLKRRPSLK